MALEASVPLRRRLRAAMATSRARLMMAAALAAVAESGLIFLPLMQLSSESAGAHGGPLATYWVFVPIFVGAVILGVASRRTQIFATAVAAGALLLGGAQVLIWGNGNLPATAGFAVLSLMAGVRVVGLALRNWHDPVKGSFAAGSAALLVEIALTSSAGPGWRAMLPPIAVLFFICSLASRALSVMTVDRVRPEGQTEGRRPGPRVVVLVLAGLGALMTLALLLGGPSGALELAGRRAYDLVVLALLGLAWVAARLLLAPINWLLVRLHISLAPLRSLSRSLSRLSIGTQGRSAGSGWLERLIGLAVLAAAAYFLIRSIRLRWPESGRAEREAEHATGGIEGEPSLLARWRIHAPRFRREMPANVVRRMYAEALLGLERRGVPKPAWATPDEYLGQASGAIPECRRRFVLLTRAYEDVRYGSMDVDLQVFEQLKVGHSALLETIRRSERTERLDAEDSA